ASHLARGGAGNWTLEDLLTHAPANYGHRTPEDDYLSAAIGAIEMLKTGCTSAYDLYMAVPAITDEAFEATVRAYTDVGVRVVLAPAVADVVFFQTVPGLIDLLPPDLRRTVEGMRAARTRLRRRARRVAGRRRHANARRRRRGRRPQPGQQPAPGLRHRARARAARPRRDGRARHRRLRLRRQPEPLRGAADRVGGQH